MTITCTAPGMDWPVAGSMWGRSTLTGLSSAPSTGQASQRGLYRLVESGHGQFLLQPPSRTVNEPGRHRHAQQHLDQVRGPFGRHIPRSSPAGSPRC